MVDDIVCKCLITSCFFCISPVKQMFGFIAFANSSPMKKGLLANCMFYVNWKRLSCRFKVKIFVGLHLKTALIRRSG